MTRPKLQLACPFLCCVLPFPCCVLVPLLLMRSCSRASQACVVSMHRGMPLQVRSARDPVVDGSARETRPHIRKAPRTTCCVLAACARARSRACLNGGSAPSRPRRATTPRAPTCGASARHVTRATPVSYPCVVHATAVGYRHLLRRRVRQDDGRGPRRHPRGKGSSCPPDPPPDPPP